MHMQTDFPSRPANFWLETGKILLYFMAGFLLLAVVSLANGGKMQSVSLDKAKFGNHPPAPTQTGVQEKEPYVRHADGKDLNSWQAAKYREIMEQWYDTTSEQWQLSESTKIPSQETGQAIRNGIDTLMLTKDEMQALLDKQYGPGFADVTWLKLPVTDRAIILKLTH